MKIIKSKSDILGTFASSLCLIHCVFTPFLFIVQAGAASSFVDPPVWWKFMDFIFLIISFVAIYWSSKKTTLKWMKPLLWLNWGFLLLIILNEKLELFPLSESAIYVPAIALILLHTYNMYNKKYGKYDRTKCYVNEG